jgi:hypothetical protein
VSHFGKRGLWVILALGLGAFGTALVGMVFGDNPVPESVDPTGFSRSALGHKAFVALCRALDIPVHLSRHRSAERAAAAGGLLVLAEPMAQTRGGKPLSDVIESSPMTLLVLPKRRGAESHQRPGWIGTEALLSTDEVERVLDQVVPGAKVVRPASIGSVWTEADESFLGLRPELTQPQLIRASEDELLTLVGTEEGTLIGYAQEGRVMLVSEPDLIATHGLGRGMNAALAIAAVRFFEPRSVVVDEVFHGLDQVPNLWRELLQFPVVLVLVQVGLALLVLLWHGLPRFGPGLELPPALEAGKAFLIHNTAELLRFGGHSRESLDRFLTTTVETVAGRLHAPRGLDGRARLEWLARLEKGKRSSLSILGLQERLDQIHGRGDRRQVLALAGDIHRWRQERVDAAFRPA